MTVQHFSGLEKSMISKFNNDPKWNYYTFSSPHRNIEEYFEKVGELEIFGKFDNVFYTK